MEYNGVHINTSNMSISFKTSLANVLHTLGCDNGTLTDKLGIQESSILPFDKTLVQENEERVIIDNSVLSKKYPDTLETLDKFTECLLYSKFTHRVFQFDLSNFIADNISHILCFMLIYIDDFNPYNDIDIVSDGIEQLGMSYTTSQIYADIVGKQDIVSKKKLLDKYGLVVGNYGLMLELNGYHVTSEDFKIAYQTIPELPSLFRIVGIHDDYIEVQKYPELHTYAENLRLWESLPNKHLVKDILKPIEVSSTHKIYIRDIALEFYPAYDESIIVSPLSDIHEVTIAAWMGTDQNNFDGTKPPIQDKVSERIAIYTALAQYGFEVPSDRHLPWYAKRVNYKLKTLGSVEESIDDTHLGSEEIF